MIRMIGYWITSFEDLKFLAPQELVGSYSGDMKEIVVAYLEGGRELNSCFGDSWCRFPSCSQYENHAEMGSREFTDGIWAWPEGLKHYVVKHNVMLPEEFISHVLANNSINKSVTQSMRIDETDLGVIDSKLSGCNPFFHGLIPSNSSRPDIDFSFWIEWCRTHGSGLVRNRINSFREQAARTVALGESEAESTFKAECCEMEQKNGLSLERCKWSKCERQALRGKAICAIHLMKPGLFQGEDSQVRSYIHRDYLRRFLIGE